MTLWPDSIFPSVKFPIALAQTPDDIIKVGQLRYDLYVNRDGKAYQYADHRRRTLVEPIDRLSLNFYASDGSGTCSAVRLTRAEDAGADPLLAGLLAHSGTKRLAHMVACSRFVVQPTISARRTIIPLFKEVYRAGLKAGATKCLLATRTPLIGIFMKFGFRAGDRRFVDRVAGELSLCELDLHDLEHLVSITSPLVDVVREQFSVEERRPAAVTTGVH